MSGKEEGQKIRDYSTGEKNIKTRYRDRRAKTTVTINPLQQNAFVILQEKKTVTTKEYASGNIHPIHIRKGVHDHKQCFVIWTKLKTW